MRYEILLTRQARKDFDKLTPKLQTKFKEILRNKLAKDPYSGKHLTGKLKGHFSVRLSYQDRIVYRIVNEELIVIVIRAKTHYGK
jgi:addiction module RelE/StbE family toxin